MILQELHTLRCRKMRFLRTTYIAMYVIGVLERFYTSECKKKRTVRTVLSLLPILKTLGIIEPTLLRELHD